jgi:hypothetical protein
LSYLCEVAGWFRREHRSGRQILQKEIEIRMHFRWSVRRSMWIAGVGICSLAALGIVAIARTIPASYANIPGKDARSKDRTAPARMEDAGAKGPQVHVVLQPIAVSRPGRVPCSECGVIESMRQIERSSDSGRERAFDVKGTRGVPNTSSGVPITASAATEKRYEFTVRFRDGSTTVFSEAGARAWPLGSRVMVIGRAGAVNN